MSKIEVNQIDTISGSSTLLVGPSAATKLTFSSTLTVDFNVNSPGVTLNSTMKMTPSFLVIKTTAQSIGSGVYTTIQFDNEIYDTDDCFDSSSTYRFTPTVAGKYWVYGQMRSNSSSDFTSWQPFIYKNGSKLIGTNNSHWHFESVHFGVVVDFNGSTDYVEVRGYQDSGTDQALGTSASEYLNNFGAYKLIGT
jgi:hypothetical protein